MSEENRGRGRPKGVKNARKPATVEKTARKVIRDPIVKKVCVCCGKEMAVSHFYKSNSNLHLDGLSPYCKSCICSECLTDGHVDQTKLRGMCQTLNRPWVEDVLSAAYSEFQNNYLMDHPDCQDEQTVVSKYLKNVSSLPQYSRIGYDQWEQKKLVEMAGTNKNRRQQSAPSIKKAMAYKEVVQDDEPIYLDDEKKFKVTPDIIQKFGQGYTRREYKAMVDKYAFLSQSYPDLTNLHTEALVTYVRYKVKEEFAVAEGDVDTAEKYAAMASKQADKAKINPSQLSANDLQGGLNSFSELMMAIEQAADIIPILPQFKFRPSDSVDFTIWCIINYLRKAEGKPLCSYEDVWHFYDERKAEYIEQYGDPTGIFADDPTESNRGQVQKFITLPKEYANG